MGKLVGDIPKAHIESIPGGCIRKDREIATSCAYSKVNDGKL